MIIRVSHPSLAADAAGAELGNKISYMEAVKCHDILRTVQYLKEKFIINVPVN